MIPDGPSDELRLLAELRAARPSAARLSWTEGASIQGYRIEREIRRGGQGIVYRAIQEATKRPVALKVLLAGPDTTGRERRRFEREVELASRMDHPGIVAPYDCGVSEGVPWCAMELVDGIRLDEWADHRPRKPAESVELVRRIASTVAHAHQRGVIHRDLKPANVLVDRAGEPHVLDFGAALDEADPRGRLRMTAPGEFLGTLAYAAPEQLRGAPHPTDTRTDVYALGMILYELLTRGLPHGDCAGVAEIVERVTTRRPSPPSELARGIDRDLDAVVLKSLAIDPIDRYGSAETFERDLARWLAGEPVTARRQSFAYVLRKHVQRRKKFVAAGLGVVLLGGALVFAWLREHQRADRQVEQAALIRSVIQDLLAAAAPQRMGGDARLIDVYEVLARDLETALPGSPDVQAEVELTIGDTYRRLLRSPEAEPHLRKALERFRELDRDDLDVARAANALALTLADSNRPEAPEVAAEALAIRERELDPGDPRLAESRRTLAIALLCQFRDVEIVRARSLLESALRDQIAAYGDGHPEVAETRLSLADASHDLPPAAVEALLSSALTAIERSAPQDPRALRALTAYAAFLQSEGRFEETRALLDRAGILARDLFGDALASDLLRRHARLEFVRGDLANAELLSRQAVARELERWATNRPASGKALRSLARRVEQPGSPSAEPPYAEAFAELRALEGNGSFELAGWMNGICTVLRGLHRGSSTEGILREALEIRCRAMGSDCPIRRQTIELLADELAAQGRGGEAVPLLEESLEAYERTSESATPEAARARELLASCRAQTARDGGSVEPR